MTCEKNVRRLSSSVKMNSRFFFFGTMQKAELRNVPAVYWLEDKKQNTKKTNKNQKTRRQIKPKKKITSKKASLKNEIKLKVNQ